MSWRKMKLKYLTHMQSGNSITSESIDTKGEYPVYGGGVLRGYTDNYTHDGGYILIGRQGANCGSVKEVKGKFFASEHAVVVTPNKKVDNGWLYYLLESMNLNQYSISAAQPGLAVSSIKNLEVTSPSYEIQVKTRQYIDKRTKMFENIIAQKEKMINLLEQQRQSIITETVTKGLNSNVKMKDSGVEWIGEIPEHWEIKALKYCFKIGNGKKIDVELDIENESGINVYGSGGIFKKTNKVLFEGESVLFGRKGTIGKPLYVNDVFWTVDTMYYTEFYKKSYPKWFYYLLLVYPWDLIITQTALPSVVGSDVTNTICAIPSFGEQVEIAEYLSLRDEKHFKLVENINNQIQKLKEYRQALIYEAVTGKIDVREMEID